MKIGNYNSMAFKYTALERMQYGLYPYNHHSRRSHYRRRNFDTRSQKHRRHRNVFKLGQEYEQYQRMVMTRLRKWRLPLDEFSGAEMLCDFIQFYVKGKLWNSRQKN